GGVYALGMLRGQRDDYHRSGVTISLAVGSVAALLQLFSGDLLAKHTAEHNPVKLAAMEAHFKTESGASLVIGGIPDPEAREVNFAIKVPYALSILAKNDPNAEVMGLDKADEKDWPNVLLTHLSFQVMVGCGTALIALGAWYWLVRWRRPGPESNRLLWAVVL